jgi:hypothetical protein
MVEKFVMTPAHNTKPRVRSRLRGLYSYVCFAPRRVSGDDDQPWGYPYFFIRGLGISGRQLGRGLIRHIHGYVPIAV